MRCSFFVRNKFTLIPIVSLGTLSYIAILFIRTRRPAAF
jgi:maltodextrin utilization protein YvdJ